MLDTESLRPLLSPVPGLSGVVSMHGEYGFHGLPGIVILMNESQDDIDGSEYLNCLRVSTGKYWYGVCTNTYSQQPSTVIPGFINGHDGAGAHMVNNWFHQLIQLSHSIFVDLAAYNEELQPVGFLDLIS